MAASGIPGTTDVNIWAAKAAGDGTDLDGKPAKAAPPYVFMVWRDSDGNAFVGPHAERAQAQEMLRHVLLVVGVSNDSAVLKAFNRKVGPSEDKVMPMKVDGLSVIVEVERMSDQIDRRVFVGPPGFKIPEI